MLSWLTGVIFGKDDDQLVQLPSGQFYRLDPSNSKAPRTLIFKDASLTVRRSQMPFHYQLVVERLYEEGEEELDASDEDEKSFLIDPELAIRLVQSSWMWQDIQSSQGPLVKGFEFISDDSVNQVTIKTFEEVVYHCMFERLYRKPHTEATIEDMRKFIQDMKDTAARVNFHVQQSVPQSPVKIETKVNPMAAHIPVGEVLFNCNAQLYMFDSRIIQFVLMQPVVIVEVIQSDKYQFFLLVRHASEPIVCQPIDTKMNAVFNHEQKSFVWVYSDDDGQPLYSLSLKFEDETPFKSVFARCIYESSNGEAFSKIKNHDQEYLMDAFQEDVDMEDAEPVEEEDNDEGEEIRGIRSRHEDLENPFVTDKKAQNSQLAVGYKHDRSFVVRGSDIGVFKHTDDDQLEFSTAIRNIQSLGGALFSPRKVMLHDQDSSMLMMKPGDQHNIYKMDLEYGKVVEEWKVDDILPVNEIVPDTKYAQMTPMKTIIGLNHNSIFRIDSRLSGTKRVEGESKQYVTKNDFSCGATTGKGELAVGSNKGEIRLYNKLNIRAKTHLPGLGDPIMGIDSTENGRFIIATCKSYLLLIDTEIKDGSKASGFQKSMGEYKPVPKRLQLKPEDVTRMGVPVQFTPAKFNTGAGDEKTIVTSSGPFVITWNFRLVKQGKLYSYTIREYQDKVVADNFKYGQDRSIIVALPENVEMISKSTLQTPAKLLKSRNSIVNSPF